MPTAACGSHRKRKVPGRASFTRQTWVPVNVSGVVRRLNPGAITCASWSRLRSRTVSVYVPTFIDLTVFPDAVWSVIVNPGPLVSTSFVFGVTVPAGAGVGDGEGEG